MSTFYYVCCRSHRLRGPLVAGRSFPDRWWGPNGEEANILGEFVRDHYDCGHLTILSEHLVDNYRGIDDDEPLDLQDFTRAR